MQVEVTGKTVEEAIQQALQQLGVSQDQVEVEILSPGTPGIFGIGAEPARVRVTVRKSPATFVKDLLTQIVKYAGWDLRVEEPEEREGEVYVNMEGGDAGLIIGKRGETLNALQLVVQAAASKQFQQPLRIVLDASRYRERRRAAVIQLALNAAERARSQKRSVRLRNLSASERRIIHMTLQNDPTVFTLSEGEGEERIVIVAPIEMRERLLRRLRASRASRSAPPSENSGGSVGGS